MPCMQIAPDQLPDDIDALKSLVADQATKLDHFTARNEQLTTENQRYKTQVLTLTEQLNLALAKRYLTRPRPMLRRCPTRAMMSSLFLRTSAGSAAANRCPIICPGSMWSMRSRRPSDAAITTVGYWLRSAMSSPSNSTLFRQRSR